MKALPNLILIGSQQSPAYRFDNASIASVGGTFSVDVIGDELAFDQASAVVRDGSAAVTIYAPTDTLGYRLSDGRLYKTRSSDSALPELPYGTPVWWRNNGVTRMAGYLKEVSRIARAAYKLTFMSGVGLLVNQYHEGGLYTGQLFPAVVADIIGGAFPYELAPEVEGLEIYGWLPYDTRRDNLHQLLFAEGVSLLKGGDGRPRFGFLTAAAPVPVEDRRRERGSVVYATPATRADVTEHTYFQSSRDETAVLFDNTTDSAIASGQRVIFDAPAYDLTTTGTLTVSRSGVNFAIVSGVGTLSGKLYSHTTRIVSQQATDAARRTESVKRVTSMTLVNPVNSLNVARRVLAYYGSARTIRAAIALQSERCGDVLALSDPYHEKTEAFLVSADMNASANLRAVCTLVEGYTPTGQGNNVQGRTLLTGSGDYVVPAGVTEITVVLIGAGEDGAAGEDGSQVAVSETSRITRSAYFRPPGTMNGSVSLSQSSETGSAGQGGKGGSGGRGGRVLQVTLTVTPGDTIRFSCAASAAGSQDTVFGAYSSANGEYLDAGFVDVTTGQVFARRGADGEDGGNGGGAGQNGASTALAAGGEGHEAFTETGSKTNRSGSTLPILEAVSTLTATYAGAGGGGAGGGSEASPGGNGGSVTTHPSMLQHSLNVTNTSGLNYTASASVVLYGMPPGQGGDGASGESGRNYGDGGNGGGGGGGAGTTGGVSGSDTLTGAAHSTSESTQGLIIWMEAKSILRTLSSGKYYGEGGVGGRGADGCAIVYENG